MEKEFIYEDDDEINVLYLLNQYADANPSFDSKYLDSVIRYFEKHDRITKEQWTTLMKIHGEIVHYVP